MPTPAHLRTIHQGARFLKLTDPAYRTLLRNTGKVESSKDLSNAGVEDVMAVMEEMGFDRHPAGKTYWRDKVAQRAAGGVSSRNVQLIRELARQQRYSLESLVERFSQGRADRPEDLTAREAWKLTEMLKAAAKREQKPGKTPVVTEDEDAQLLPF